VSLGLPADWFVDDHWIIERASTLESGSQLLATLFDVLGFECEASKNQNSDEIVLLGAQFNLGPPVPEVTIPEVKRMTRICVIDEHLSSGNLAPAAAGKLRGSLGWAVSLLFRQSAKAELRSLTERQYRMGQSNKSTSIGSELATSLRSLRETVRLAESHPIKPRRSPGEHILIYTDGAQETRGDGVGGLIYKRSWGSGSWWTGSVPPNVHKQWKPHRKTQIINIELFALLATIRRWRSQLCDQRVICWIDNQSAFAMLCKGSATEEDTRKLVKAIWNVIEKSKMDVWFEWVESKANLADDPSRFVLASPDDRDAIIKKMAALSMRQVHDVSLKGY